MAVNRLDSQKRRRMSLDSMERKRRTEFSASVAAPRQSTPKRVTLAEFCYDGRIIIIIIIIIVVKSIMLPARRKQTLRPPLIVWRGVASATPVVD